MRTAFLALGLILAALPCMAQPSPDALKLEYRPAKADQQEAQLTGNLTDVQMNGASLMGITGKMDGSVVVKVKEVDPNNGNVILQSTYTVKTVEFAGQPREPKPAAPSEVTFTKRGQVTKIVQTGGEEGSSAMDLMSSGGLPIDAIALMALSLQFPEEPLKVGAEWTSQQEQDLPLIGKASITKVSRLVAVKDGKAIFESRESSEVPPFEMPNPLMQGTMKVQSAKFLADKIEREYDLKRSMITRAKGAFRLEINADMGFGFPTPITACGDFDWKPAPKAEDKTPEAAAPAAKAEGAAEAPAPKPAAEPQARVLKLGPLAAAAGYNAGTLDLNLALDLSRLPLPGALGQYRDLLGSAAVYARLGAGVWGAEAGKLALQGRLEAGPLAMQNEANLDLRQVAQRVIAHFLGQAPELKFTPARP